MRGLTTLLVATVMLIGGLIAPALAAPAARAPVSHQLGLGGAHPHFVITGAGCTDINSVYFEPDGGRGLHGASFASGQTRGPWHGECED